MPIYNIAILTGGDTAERVISLQSSAVVAKHLAKKDQYRCFEIDIQKAQWRERYTGHNVNKDDFSLYINGQHIHFDAVFAALHGSPLEDGKMQGYFDMLDIPYTCCDGFVSALMMDKFLSKTIARPYGIPMAKSVLLIKDTPVDFASIKTFGYPIFVKPNTMGSSFGITKVESEAELNPAIEAAFVYDDEVVVESFLSGREFSNAVFRKNGQVEVLPITEIIPHDGWFDFAAKYEGASEEVTPAVLTTAETESCKTTSKRLYDIFKCKGAVRFDYIIHKGEFCFLEGNSIPGISEGSLLPQQAIAAGYSLADFFEAMLLECLNDHSKVS